MYVSINPLVNPLANDHLPFFRVAIGMQYPLVKFPWKWPFLCSNHQKNQVDSSFFPHFSSWNPWKIHEKSMKNPSNSPHFRWLPYGFRRFAGSRASSIPPSWVAVVARSSWQRWRRAPAGWTACRICPLREGIPGILPIKNGGSMVIQWWFNGI